ncbi:MAG: hypothetical protein KGJ78_01780 [Alphaproteobacteria bacterium]|nr:hypothetical protein [Alphaproteobacteria bacterium]
MTLRRHVLDSTNRALHWAGLHLLTTGDFETLRRAYEGPAVAARPIPPEAQEYLRWNNPALLELERRYEGHPAAGHTQWRKRNLQAGIDLTRFRGDNHYVYQTRWNPGTATYFMTAQYARDIDRLGMFGRLREDGLFGAHTVEFDDGTLVSRDLLDSVNQANVIARLLGRGPGDPIRILDIGAGYGRLAHRLAEGLDRVHTTCTDAVPLSTFLSAFYLRFRGVEDRTPVVPLDDVETRLKGASFDIVTNIHSFSECRMSAIAWWFDLLGHVDVARLLIVPNRMDEFQSTESDGRHLDFLPLFAERGWKHAHSEPVYSQSSAAQRCALYPQFKFHLFER